MHEFEELEQAVLAALAPVKSQGVKTLDLYAGQAEAEDIEELARMTILFPAVFVVATGLVLDHKNHSDEEDLGVMLIVGCKNLRGTGAARRGDANSIGVYDILELTESLLHRKKIHSAGITRLRQTAPMYLAPKMGICFYAARYEFKTIKS